jgi:stage II sporulation protein M
MGAYFVVLTFFAIGVAVGAFTVKAMDDSQKQALIKYMQSFFQILTDKSVDSVAVLRQSITNNVQTIIMIWILGIAVVGIPVTLFIIGARGFIIGFTVGFLINSLGWKGLVFTLVAILPQNIIIIPCIIAISVISLSFSLMIIKNRLARRWTNNYWKRVLSYSMAIIILFIVSVLGSLVEAYIVPALMKLFSSYFTV